MLKKTIRRLGALAMVLAMAVSVFAVNASAAGETEEVPASPVYSFAKKYTTTTVTPSEALSYELVSKSAESNSVADDANLEISIAKAEGADTPFVISLPSYQGVGQFTYDMREVVGNTAGVTYDAANVRVVVTRIWKVANGGTSESNIETKVAIQKADGSAKLTEVTNTFKVGTLTVSKELAGDFYDPDDTFEIKVKFTCPTGKVVRSSFEYKKTGATTTTTVNADQWENGTFTTTISDVKGGDSFEFKNLPDGVTYEVVETTEGNTGKTTKGYTPSYNGATGTISETPAVATVTNTKNASTPTGVIMTIAPYALMVVLAGAFAVVFLTRRNRAE